jgi:alanine dehydrogenase
MARGARPLTVGLPRMHKEAGERRDFLPPLVGVMAGVGAEVVVESGIGSGIGYRDQDYLAVSPLVRVGDAEEAFGQDIVVVLRAPADFGALRPGATLVSMLHFATRPERVSRLAELGLEAVSLDSIADDDGRRLVENARAVAWNGLEASFDALAMTLPEYWRQGRRPIHLTVLGAGLVGKHAVEAGTKYGSLERNAVHGERGDLGVEVVTVGRNLTWDERSMRERLARTDILVDATQRSDPSRPVVPNAWLADLPEHSVICDLVVDPYLSMETSPTVRGIEGIPQGNLDQYTFFPHDPAWDRDIPSTTDNRNRRMVVSCYSWPGIHPRECMERYGHQLAPLLEILIERGGPGALRLGGGERERALLRASLRTWLRPGFGLPGPGEEAARVVDERVHVVRALEGRRVGDGELAEAAPRLGD